MSTNARWSRPVESLRDEEGPLPRCDVLIVGSGYGGSIAAAELAAPGRSVWVMERGREYALGEFPEDIGQLPGHVQYQRSGADEPTGNPDALLDFRLFDQVTVLVGNGLGGGSLINAGVALEPDRRLFEDPAWPARFRDAGGQEAFHGAAREMLRRLEAAPVPSAGSLPKFGALDRLGAAIGCGPAEPVPVTIAHAPRTNAQGLQQAACVHCGNCFTGCNTGAKGTLATNLIPQAARRGARFFTGAKAIEIEPAGTPGARWRVRFAYTARARAEPGASHLTVEADTLILSAGTLGSTELLLRSPKVSRSARLGHGFSTNGDAIAMGWGQKTRVGCISAPRPDSAAPSTDVGPTITGTLRTTVKVRDQQRQVLIQDGAVPSALSMAAVALGSTLSMLHRYTESADPAAYGEHFDRDPLAVPLHLAEHSQLLLAMGRDEADGVVRLCEPQPGQSRARLDVHWPRFAPRPGRPGDQGGRAPFFAQLHQLLRQAHANRGFDGGDYLPGPGWRPVPDRFTAITGGSQPEQLVTVHPLGGCAMADHAGAGVVDAHGAVFSGKQGTAVHAGLYVLDGAIVPCSVGVNPFLTISALCLLAARKLRAELDRRRPPSGGIEPMALPAIQPAAGGRTFAPWGPVVLEFQERLQSVSGGDPPPWVSRLLPAGSPEDPGATGMDAGLREWVAVVTVKVDVYRWLADPNVAHDAELRLYRNRYRHSPTVREELMADRPILQGRGRVSLLALDAPRNEAQRRSRAWEAFWTYWKRRSSKDFSSLSGQEDGRSLFIRAARNHADYRELRYEFELAPPDRLGDRVRASGRKRLAYRREERNLWDALTRLDLHLAPQDGPAWPLGLAVDLVDMVRQRRLQVRQAPNMPAGAVAIASFASMWVRCMLRTHFWSLRGLTYEQLTAVPRPAGPPLLRPHGLLGRSVAPEVQQFEVDRSTRPGDGKVRLELTCYRPERPSEGHPGIVLIHGLAHGSGVFTTDTVDHHNLASYFLGEGCTVWLLDHRLSNRLGHAGESHTMDDVARFDIAEGLRLAHAANGGRPLDVFAHCVGAGAFSMAVLGGHVDPSIVRAAILHAVHPWVVPSMSNRFSGALAALYKDLLSGRETIDPVPPSRDASVMDEVIDRFAATLPWPGEEVARHERHKYDPAGGFAVCNRMTVFYGREWEHANLDERTHQQLAGLVGVAGIEVFRQLYFLILRERLTDREGSNAYLTQPQVHARWRFPTLFAHGGRNQVFDPRSAVRSWNRMSLLLRSGFPERPVRLFVQPGYGHMDFLFGKDAHRDIFPVLQRFLRQPEAFQSVVGGRPAKLSTDDPAANHCDGENLGDYEYVAPLAPLCGPMLQVEGSADGRRRLVLWFEQRFDTASQPRDPELAIDGRTVTPQVFQLPSQEKKAPSLNPAVSNGRGWYWSVVLDEGPGLLFRDVKTLTLTARSERPSVPNVGRAERRGDLRIGLPEDALGDPPIWRDEPVWAMKPGSAYPWRNWSVPGLGRLFRVPSPAGRPAPAPSPAPGPGDFDSQRPATVELADLPWWRRWTGQVPGGPVSVLAASCRWPGTPFDREAADRLALQMESHLEHPTRPADALVLLGDQIYADATANVAETTEPSERGAQRYRDAWSGEHSRRLLGQIPTWLVVDDHEFGDNVDGPGTSPSPQFLTGFEAALAYQWRWHRNTDPPRPAGPGRPARGFWHEFDIAGIPAFAADTRTERERRTDANWHEAAMVGAAQMQAIQCWLARHPRQPKLLCCGSVLGLPALRTLEEPSLCRNADDWSGYPAAWTQLCEFIARQGIEGLVVLAGDYHLSAVAELEIRAAGAAAPARVVSVVASGWNASLPFANFRRSEHPWEQTVRLPGGCPTVDVWSTPQLLSDAQRQFTKLTFDLDGAHPVLEVASFEESGAQTRAVRLRL